MALAPSVLLLVACSAVCLEESASGPPPGHRLPPALAEPAPLVCPLEQATPEVFREHYTPREGDMVFFTYYKKLWKIVFGIGHTIAPYHVALVVKTPQGTLKLLETGSLKPSYVQLVDIMPRIIEYHGKVAVRSLRKPPLPPQSRQLTCFTQDQLGKPFGRVRVSIDGFFDRKLSLLRYQVCGPTPTDRPNWFCSELVISALIEGGLVPDDLIQPNAPFPSDLYYSVPRSIDPWYDPPVQLICAP